MNERPLQLTNALNENLLMERSRGYENRPETPPRLVAWRGTETHARDLHTHGGAWLDVSQREEFKAWRYIFFGYNPYFITDRIAHDRCLIVQPQRMHTFYELYRKQAPEILVCPLHNSVFNRCKSNIAYLEGTAMGSVVIAPDWPEWKQPGCVTYQGTDDLTETLIETMRMSDEQRTLQLRVAQKNVYTNHMLTNRHQQRMKLVNRMMGMRNERKF